METWTNNPSYPIVKVGKTDAGCLQIEQVSSAFVPVSVGLVRDYFYEYSYIVEWAATTESKEPANSMKTHFS